MKGKIAALIAGLILGTAGTAVASTSIYWTRGGNDYSCTGISGGVQCKSGGYEVGITKSFLYLQRLPKKTVYACVKWEPVGECFPG